MKGCLKRIARRKQASTSLSAMSGSSMNEECVTPSAKAPPETEEPLRPVRCDLQLPSLLHRFRRQCSGVHPPDGHREKQKRAVEFCLDQTSRRPLPPLRATEAIRVHKAIRVPELDRFANMATIFAQAVSSLTEETEPSADRSKSKPSTRPWAIWETTSSSETWGPTRPSGCTI